MNEQPISSNEILNSFAAYDESSRFRTNKCTEKQPAQNCCT